MKFKAIKAQRNIKIVNQVAYRAYLDSLEDGIELMVDIDKPKKPRTTSQNRYFWACIEEIDKLMFNADKELTKFQVLIHIGHYDEHEICGNMEKLPRRTSGLSTKDFGELMDSIIRFAVIQFSVDLTSIAGRGY